MSLNITYKDSDGTIKTVEFLSIQYTDPSYVSSSVTVTPVTPIITGSTPIITGSTPIITGSTPIVVTGTAPLPPVVSAPVSSSTYVPIFTGFSKTGKITAPLSGSGILTPAETSASVSPQGQIFSIPNLAMPTVAGQTYIDPVFNTTVRRLPDNFRHVYSQLQPFSDDDTLMLGIIVGGGYQVIRYPSMQVVTMGPNFAGTVAPRWLPNSHKLVSTDYNWSTGGSQLANVTIRMWDCDTGTVTTLFTVPFVQCNANVAEEDFSYDGQFMSLYAQDSSGVWYACIVSLHTGQVLANIPDSQFASLDWVGLSPLGTFMLTDSNGTSPPSGRTHGNGMETYNPRTGAFIKQIYDRDDHLDHGLDGHGNEVVLTTSEASQFNNNNPAIVMYNLANGVKMQLRQITWSASPDHMSMQGPPGLMILDSNWGAFDSNGNIIQPLRTTGLDPFEGEVYAMYGDGSCRRLAHHRCNPPLITNPNADTQAELRYFCQVQAACSKSGKLVAFCSNWNTVGVNPQGYVIEQLSL